MPTQYTPEALFRLRRALDALVLHLAAIEAGDAPPPDDVRETGALIATRCARLSEAMGHDDR